MTRGKYPRAKITLNGQPSMLCSPGLLLLESKETKSYSCVLSLRCSVRVFIHYLYMFVIAASSSRFFVVGILLGGGGVRSEVSSTGDRGESSTRLHIVGAKNVAEL